MPSAAEPRYLAPSKGPLMHMLSAAEQLFLAQSRAPLCYAQPDIATLLSTKQGAPGVCSARQSSASERHKKKERPIHRPNLPNRAAAPPYSNLSVL